MSDPGGAPKQAEPKKSTAEWLADGCANGCVDPDGCVGCFQMIGAIVTGIGWLGIHLAQFAAHFLHHV